MDASTPIGKFKSHHCDGDLRRQILGNECDRCSNAPALNAQLYSSVDGNDFVFSQPSDHSRLNNSEELFPFSPIPSRKEVPSTLLPLLDTPDTKWTSSILTPFQEQSGNASPELLSDDNFAQSIFINSLVEVNANYTPAGNEASFSNDTNTKNEVQSSDCVINRPSSPVVISKKTKKKSSAINKVLFPFSDTSDQCSREPSPPIDCVTMSDVTLNALEEICQNSETLYAENTLNKLCPTDNGSVRENESTFNIQQNHCQTKDRSNFIYPYENVKKPENAVRIDDILQAVLCLETNEVPTKVPIKKDEFLKGLVSFNELESLLSQPAGSLISSKNVLNEDEFHDDFKITAQFSYSPYVVRSSNRDVMNALKRFFEYYRVNFAKIMFDRRKSVRRQFLHAFEEYIHGKMSKLNWSDTSISLFCDTFFSHRHLVYNFCLSRQINIMTRFMRREMCTERLQCLNFKFQFSTDFASVASLPIKFCIPEKICAAHSRLADKCAGVEDRCIAAVTDISSMKAPEMDVDNVTLDLMEAANPLIVIKHSSCSNMQYQDVGGQRFFDKSALKICDDETNDFCDTQLVDEKLPFSSLVQSNSRQTIPEMFTGFSTASGKFIPVNHDSIICAKALLNDVILPQAAKTDEYFFKIAGISNCRVDDSVIGSKKDIAETSQKLVSTCSANMILNDGDIVPTLKTPFDDDLDTTDLLFICDLSEKVVLPSESPVTHENDQSTKDCVECNFDELKNVSTDPTTNDLHHSENRKFVTDLSNHSRFDLKTDLISAERVSKFLVQHSAVPKNVGIDANSSVIEKLIVDEKMLEGPRKSIPRARTDFKNDIENWNPELPIAAACIKSVASENYVVGNDCLNSEKPAPPLHKSTFIGFSTATGRKIDVKSSSLEKAKQLLDSVRVEPEAVIDRYSNQDLFNNTSTSNACEPGELNDEICDRTPFLAAKQVSVSMKGLTEMRHPLVLKNEHHSKETKSKWSKNRLSVCATTPAIMEKNNQSTLCKSSKIVPALENSDTRLLPRFSNFSTACGKKMVVSEKSLRIARKLYESTLEEKPANEIITSDETVAKKCAKNAETFCEPVIERFATNPSSVEIKQSSNFDVAVAENVIVDEDVEKKVDKLFAHSTKNAFPGEFPGFSSASGKKMCVTEKSLLNAKKLYKSVSEEHSSTCSSEFDGMSSSKAHRSIGFKTASGKKLRVNEESLRNAENIFDSIAEVNFENAVKCVESEKNEKNAQPFPSFSSASGKKIKVTEKSLQKAKELCESAAMEPFSDDFEGKIIEPKTGEKFASFSTAAGKELLVKEKSLREAKKLYASTVAENRTDLIDSAPANGETSFRLGGIDSVSNRAVNLVGYSSRNAKKLHGYSSLGKDGCKIAKCGEESLRREPSFSSASGKQLVVVAESLKKARNLYDSVSAEHFASSVEIAASSPQQFANFSTASGKKLTVTEKSLQSARKLCESVSEETVSCKVESSPTKCSLVVSEVDQKAALTEELVESSQKSHESVSDEDDAEEIVASNNVAGELAPVMGFSSAAGKRISVAEKNLRKARKMLDSVAEEPTDDFRSTIPSEKAEQLRSVNRSVGARLQRYRNDHLLGNSSSLSCGASKKMKIEIEFLNRDVQSSKIPFESESSFDETSKETLATRIVDNKMGEDLFGVSSTSSSDRPHQKLGHLSVDIENSTFSPKISQELDDSLSQNTQVLFTSVDDADEMYDPWRRIDSIDDLELADAASKTKLATDSTTAGLNISQEISESTSAFLLDMKHEDGTVFAPSRSPSCLDADERCETSATPVQPAKCVSPVFDSSKPNRKRRSKKRRSQHSSSLNPLDITYVRKEVDNAAACSCKSSPEDVLKKFNENFAQKVNKRKEPASVMAYPSSKKAKEASKEAGSADRRTITMAEQQKFVNSKDKELCKPRIGSILAEKLSGERKTLKEAVSSERPQRWSAAELLRLGLKKSVIDVTAENAHEFVFTSEFLSCPNKVTYGDDCVVIPNEKMEVCFDDLARSFLASPGVDPRLISIPWIRNHFRWIIWKLASTERSFPKMLGGKYLTLDNVLLQLKFRYDWEVDRCRRSALKRILECDNAASDCMILCVASLKTIVSTLNEYEIELTDGWYSVPCLFDGEMLKLLNRKKVAVGTKLVIANAELGGAGEGCDPLQLHETTRLKMSTNSVRRARWYAPLGFYHGNSIRVSDLRNILPNGGIIPQFSAIIARVYPILYLEKKEDGSCVLYNEKIHFKKIADFENRRLACLENLLSQVTSEVQDENPLLDNDEYQNLDSDSDPLARQNRRYIEHERLQTLIQERVKQKLPEEFKVNRPASCMLKMRLVNSDADCNSSSVAMLTVWHPPEDLVSLLSEGKLYEFSKVVACGYRSGQVQLSANRMTKYKEIPKSSKFCNSRRVTPINMLSREFTAEFGEVDVVGLVVSVANDTKNDCSLTVYLADLEQNLMAVKFRTNVKDFGFEETLKLKNVIAGLNLLWKRSFCHERIPLVCALELATFVYKSRCKHLQNRIDEFDRFFKNKNLDAYIMECNEKLNDIIAGSGPSATSTPLKPTKRTSVENETDLTIKRTNNSSSAFRTNDRPLQTIENSTTLEQSNNSSLKQNLSSDFVDNCSNINSKSARSRIERLRGYGEPPPLSPIAMNSRSKGSRLSIQTRVQKLSINKT